MGRETLGEVWNGSGDLRGGTGRVAGPSERFGTGWKTSPEVRDGSEEPTKGSGWFGGPYQRSGMGRGTLGEVRYGSRDPRGLFGMVRVTIGEVCDG